MQFRELGSSGLRVPVVTFGAWAIGGWWWGGSDDEAAVEALSLAPELGVTAVDTAPIYGFGHSEEVVGRAIAGHRDRYLVMTKVGLRWDDERGEPFFKTRRDNRLLSRQVMVRRNSRPDSVREECERSLRRLGVEYVDLLQVHWPDPTTPIADTMGALAELHAQGYARAIGVSNFDAAQLAEAQAALDGLPLASNQCRYNLLHRGHEAETIPCGQERGLGFLAYSPLAQGLLTGKVSANRRFRRGDGRRERPEFTLHNRTRVRIALDTHVRPISERLGASPAQVVLAWTAAQPGISSILVGIRDRVQLREDAHAGSLELRPEDLSALRDAFDELDLDMG